MSPSRFAITRRRAALALLVVGLAACAPVPPAPPKPVATPDTAAPLGKKSVHVTLDEYFSLDYEIETKLSNVDNKSCYAFISGTLNNHSPRTLGRRSVLDFIVMHKNERLFRDLSSPRSDIPPGGRVMFEMIVSPVHKNFCPSYDRIDISLRKAYPG